MKGEEGRVKGEGRYEVRGDFFTFVVMNEPRIPIRDDCRHFNGYKPCFPGFVCREDCPAFSAMGMRILIVNLDAMGDVLMTTAQLRAIREQWPKCFLTWITRSNAVGLLRHNAWIDRVVEWDEVTRMVLSRQRFDLVLNADKAADACAFVAGLNAAEVRGFTLSENGHVLPANEEAWYNFALGLDDHLKFRVNTRTGQEILAETWKLPWRKDPYLLTLSGEEQRFCDDRREEWGLRGKQVVGLNTGCSLLFPNKKLTVEQQALLARILARDEEIVLLLLGGREDSERMEEIATLAALPADRLRITPSNEGLRRGICYEQLADVVVSGDSFGMHLAIALGKHVVAWYGVSCWEEIDLYDKGSKIIPAGLDCAPCWKKSCPHNLECMTRIDIEEVAARVRAALADRGHRQGEHE